MDRSKRVDFTSDEQEGASALLAIPAILLIIGLVVLLPGAQDMKEAHKPELANLILKVAVSFIVLGIAGIIALWKMR